MRRWRHSRTDGLWDKSNWNSVDPSLNDRFNTNLGFNSNASDRFNTNLGFNGNASDRFNTNLGFNDNASDRFNTNRTFNDRITGVSEWLA